MGFTFDGQTHPDLQPNIFTNPGEVAGNGLDDDGNGYIDDVHGWDFANNDNIVYNGINGHGTHVAGTVGAVGNNQMGVTGVTGPSTYCPPSSWSRVQVFLVML